MSYIQKQCLFTIFFHPTSAFEKKLGRNLVAQENSVPNKKGCAS